MIARQNGMAPQDPNRASAAKMVLAAIAAQKEAGLQLACSPPFDTAIDMSLLTAAGAVPREIAIKILRAGIEELAPLVGASATEIAGQDGIARIAREVSLKFDRAPPPGCDAATNTLAGLAPNPGFRPKEKDIRKLANTFPDNRSDTEKLKTGPTVSEPKAAPPAIGLAAADSEPRQDDRSQDAPLRTAFQADSVNYRVLSGVNAMISTATGGQFRNFPELFGRLESAERQVLQLRSTQTASDSDSEPAQTADVRWIAEPTAIGKMFPPDCLRSDGDSTFDTDMFLNSKIDRWRADRRLPNVPTVDPHYRFGREALATLMSAIRCDKRFMLVGPTGCGKTSFYEQVAARMRLPFFRIPIDGEMRRRDIVGGYIQKTSPTGSYTEWQDGILVTAYAMPCLIDLDEFDRSDTDLAYAAAEALEGKPLQIVEQPGRTVPKHPGCCIAAAANTKGGGDPTGLYAVQTTLSEATRNRFAYWLDHDYLTVEQEAELIGTRFPRIQKAIATTIAEIASDLRRALKAETIRTACSTRQVLDIAEDILDRSAYDTSPQRRLAKQALRRIVANRACDAADRAAVEGIIETRLP
jgi:MoxR-like ATPase